MHSSSRSLANRTGTNRARTVALPSQPGPLRAAAVAFLLTGAGCHTSNAHEARLVADTAELPNTELIAGLGAPLLPQQNQFWCASLAFAWQALEDEIGEPLVIAEPPAEVEWIRATNLRAGDLDADTIFTEVGRGPAALEKIQADLTEAGLSWEAEDSELAEEAMTDPLTYFAYARLTKALPFAKRFDDFEDWSLSFETPGAEETTPVDAFGVSSYDPDSRRELAMAAQIRVHHYTDRQNFVVELEPEGARDRIFIARLPEGETLHAVWETLAAHLVEAPSGLHPGDSFIAPELDLRLVQQFPSLAGLRFPVAGQGEQLIGGVVQDLDLSLDEEGMLVRSRAMITAGSAELDQVRRMVCDGPFVVAAMEADDAEPYFVAWIGHPEVLHPQPGSNE